jgi:phosphate-selective porin OprO/OprP
LDHALRTGVALLATSILVGGAAALAEEPKSQKTVTEEVLDILRAQGTIDDAKYDELKRRAEEEQRARDAAAQQAPATPAPTASAAAPPATPDPEGWKAYFKDNLRIERNDGKYKFKFGGRIQYDIAGISSDQELQDAGFDNQGTGTDFRRARIAFEGELGEHALFKAEYDFASGGDADFTDVFVGLQRLPWVGRFQAGHFKEAMSLEEQTSSKYITFMERGLPVLAFSPARNSGVALQNALFGERMTWAVGGFRDVGDFGEDFSDGSNYNVTARITGLPVWEDEGKQAVHVGYSYSHRFRDDEPVTIGPRPEVNVSSPLVSTGEIESDGVDVFGAEFAAVLNSLSFQSEFLDALVDQESGDSKNFYGVYALVSWFVTGERRVYDPKIGAFGRTSPAEPLSLSKGQWGALELAARYSHLNLNDGRIRGGIENDVTAGVNWYLYSNLRVMLNWVYAHRADDGDQHAIMSRFSLDF